MRGLNSPNLVLKLIALITLLRFVYFLIKKVLFYSSLSAGLFSSLECFSFSVRIPDFFFMSPFLHKTISYERQTEMEDVNIVCMPCYTVIKYLFHGPLILHALGHKRIPYLCYLYATGIYI